MATSDGLDGCLQRGRSQSDPNILTEPGIDLAHGTGKTHASLSGYLRAYRGKCLHLFIFYVMLPLVLEGGMQRFSIFFSFLQTASFARPLGYHNTKRVISPYASKLGRIGKKQQKTPNRGAAN